MPDVISCPWGDPFEEIDLRGVPLKINERQYLGQRLLFRGSTKAKVIRLQYNIPHRTIYQYRHKIQSDSKFYAKRGRPSCLDNEKCKRIIDALRNNPHMPERSLTSMIRDVHQKPISHRTVKRYSKMLREELVAGTTEVVTAPCAIQPQSFPTNPITYQAIAASAAQLCLIS
jgi:transposase